MMETVAFDTGTLPDTAMDSWGVGRFGLAAATILLVIGFLTGRAIST